MFLWEYQQSTKLHAWSNVPIRTVTLGPMHKPIDRMRRSRATRWYTYMMRCVRWAYAQRVPHQIRTRKYPHKHYSTQLARARVCLFVLTHVVCGVRRVISARRCNELWLPCSHLCTHSHTRIYEHARDLGTFHTWERMRTACLHGQLPVIQFSVCVKLNGFVVCEVFRTRANAGLMRIHINPLSSAEPAIVCLRNCYQSTKDVWHCFTKLEFAV